jgi:hypothetical protein
MRINMGRIVEGRYLNKNRKYEWGIWEGEWLEIT